VYELLYIEKHLDIDALATHSNEEKKEPPENLYSNEHVDCYPNIIEAPVHHESRGIFSNLKTSLCIFKKIYYILKHNPGTNRIIYYSTKLLLLFFVKLQYKI